MAAKNPVFRPRFHFTAPYGWLNDPNGLVFDGTNYHLFYQYNPYACDWASMHWGHAISTDLFHWEDLPIALTPEEFYEKHPQGGCFSGSAIYTKDGEMMLFYTGSVPTTPEQQSQNLAISKDGVVFKKYQQNPVIPQHPPLVGSKEFRDPKVFLRKGTWYMVVASCLGDQNGDGDGRILLYTSKDGYKWEYKSVLFASGGNYGSMFECPDFFPLNDRWVLIFSPMYMDGFLQCIWLVGDMDFETGIFTPEKEGRLDYGHDHYAPQTFEDESGERTAIAWMGNWPWMPWFNGYGPTQEEGWRGCMSLPRRYFLNKQNELCSLPVSSLSSLYKTTFEKSNFLITKTLSPLVLPSKNQYELNLTFSAQNIGKNTVTLSLMNGDAILEINPNQENFYFSRKREKETRPCPLEIIDGLIRLQIVVDHCTIEIFSETGKYAFSSRVFPAHENTIVSISATEAIELPSFRLHMLKTSMPNPQKRAENWNKIGPQK